MLPAEKLECPHLTVLSFLLDPCPVSIYIIAIRCTGIGKHLSTVTAVIPYVIPLYPASYHIAGCIKEVPVIVDILPLVYRIAAVRVAVPPAGVIFKPCALTSVCVSRAAVIIYGIGRCISGGFFHCHGYLLLRWRKHLIRLTLPSHLCWRCCRSHVP